MQLKSLTLAAAFVAGAVASQDAQSELQTMTAEQLGAMSSEEATFKCGALCGNICKRDLAEAEEVEEAQQAEQAEQGQAPACILCKNFAEKTCKPVHKRPHPRKCRAGDRACCRRLGSRGGRACRRPPPPPPPPRPQCHGGPNCPRRPPPRPQCPGGPNCPKPPPPRPQCPGGPNCPKPPRPQCPGQPGCPGYRGGDGDDGGDGGDQAF